MILKEWLEKEGVKAYRLAKDVNVSPSSLYKSMSGVQRLSATNAVKVEELTGGGVSRAEAMWPEYYGSDEYKETLDLKN